MKVTRVAVFEPNPSALKVLSQGLRKAGLKLSKAKQVEQLGAEELVVFGPSLKHAAEKAKEVRERLPDAILLVGKQRLGSATYADGLLPLPVSPLDLKVRLPELARWKEAQREPHPVPPDTEEESPLRRRPGDGIVDPLTSFYTFDHFRQILFTEVKRARRYGYPLSISFIAVDPPKAGTTPTVRAQLMSALALAIRKSLRDTDIPVQHHAERVLLLMPHTDLKGALTVSKRIAETVGKSAIMQGEELVHPTISIGVAGASDTSKDFSFAQLTRHAQASLQMAISRGGNRVEFYDRPMPPPLPNDAIVGN